MYSEPPFGFRLRQLELQHAHLTTWLLLLEACPLR